MLFRGLGVWGLGFRVYHKPIEAIELEIFHMSGFVARVSLRACLKQALEIRISGAGGFRV